VFRLLSESATKLGEKCHGCGKKLDPRRVYAPRLAHTDAGQLRFTGSASEVCWNVEIQSIGQTVQVEFGASLTCQHSQKCLPIGNVKLVNGVVKISDAWAFLFRFQEFFRRGMQFGVVCELGWTKSDFHIQAIWGSVSRQAELAKGDGRHRSISRVFDSREESAY
jgi:hypothetical protein